MRHVFFSCPCDDRRCQLVVRETCHISVGRLLGNLSCWHLSGVACPCLITVFFLAFASSKPTFIFSRQFSSDSTISTLGNRYLLPPSFNSDHKLSLTLSAVASLHLSHFFHLLLRRRHSVHILNLFYYRSMWLFDIVATGAAHLLTIWPLYANVAYTASNRRCTAMAHSRLTLAYSSRAHRGINIALLQSSLSAA